MMQYKQKGFTLLELLVVITLLAVLSVGALVAYEGIGDNAQATAAANNTAGTDRAIRNFRAVKQVYPDQFDNLSTAAGLTPAFLATETQAAFANVAIPAAEKAVLDPVLQAAGITALQVRATAPATVGVEPNLQHNEGAAGAANAVQTLVTAVTNYSILPTFGTAVCTVGAAAITKLDGNAATAADGAHQNVVNDSLETNECNLILALGFGHDAAHSTTGSSVAISTAPTFVSKNINPATNYARYIALFHVGADGNGDNSIDATEILPKVSLLAVVDPEGNVIDEAIAAQNP